MRALVTGGAGFIGSNLVDSLLERGDDVAVVDDLSSGKESNLAAALDRGARLHLTPGMTGPWQILGSARVPLHEMVNIDYLYVANWTFWTDAKILLRTVTYMVRGGGM